MDIQAKGSLTAFLDGGGKMGALMRSYDWNQTELGDPAHWPAALKSAIATCLSSRFPMVVWWGPRLLMLYNDAWQPILGDIKHPAGLGRPGEELWPETWPVVGAQFEKALKGVASWSEDLLLASDRHGFLEESYFTYSHGPLRDASGEVVGVLSVVSETTARVLNERRLQTLTRLSTATIDATGRLEPLAEMCQLLVDTLCRDNPDAPFAAQYLAESSQPVRRIAVAGLDVTRLPQSVRSTDQDGWGIAEALRSRSYVATNFAASEQLPGGVWPEPTTELLVLPLFHSGHDADVCGILLVGINSRLRLDTPYIEFLRLVAAQFGTAISALQSVHRERAARADAQRAARMRDEFLATLSHELRSPLNAVMGWTQILKSKMPGPDVIAKAVDVIERNARLQTRLVTDLLDISRAISGNLQLEAQDVDIAEVIGAAIESVAPTAAAKGITITTALDPTYQSVRGDPARIEQMLWNLLSNALKFTPGGGQVQVVTEADDRYLSIRVSDNGEGIDPAFLPHLFERFRQADASSSRKHQGLGLGLAIVKQFAELQAGRVSAISDGVGRGATFVLELPRGDVARPLAATALQKIAATSVPSQPDLSGLSVLVVDDQPDALLVLELILKEAAAKVTTASCAEDALEILSRERFDVIVSDIAMPGMDGYDFVTELPKRGIDTPTIALTAFALHTDVRKASAAGFKAHISKPIDRASLLATVSRLTNRDRR
jgi:signal transduction histidine kinase/CheY-like chemotaxis protein